MRDIPDRVCPQVCRNEAAGLCQECAPDLAGRRAAIQAQVAVEQAWQQARSVDQTAGAGLGADARFCPRCGRPVAEP